MTAVRAFLAFMQGAETYRRRALRRLSGSPFTLRLTYLGGHPGIWQPATFWVGRVGDRLRLVDEQGLQCYDLPMERICGLSYEESGYLKLRFEPTAGLLTTVEFQTPNEVTETYQKLFHLMAV